jgi:hypothetical protein
VAKLREQIAVRDENIARLRRDREYLIVQVREHVHRIRVLEAELAERDTVIIEHLKKDAH